MPRLVVMLTVAALGAAAPAAAQEIPQVIAHPEMLERELDRFENADKICWKRGEPRSVDWLAQRDAGYRALLSRYGFQETDDGWRWYRGDLSRGSELRPVEGEVRGETAVDLEVHHGHASGEPWATLAIAGPLKEGGVRFDWTLPPERVCMSEGLALTARVAVTDGEPGAHKIMFVMPLDQEQMALEGPEVKACSPNASTSVDSEIDFDEDHGVCERQIYHLQPMAAWDLWVSLPESFYVVYPYEPDLER